MKTSKYKFYILMLLLFLSINVTIFHIISQNITQSKIMGNKSTITSVIQEIDHTIFQITSKSTEKLSDIIWIKRLVAGHNSKEKVIDIITTTKQILDADIVYLMEKSGNVIASTTYNNNGDTLEGRNYKFRKYFQGAIQGEKIIYPAVGVTSNKRGLYFSSPVYLDDNLKKPEGVIVIKIGLKNLDKMIQEIKSPTVLVSDLGVVFATNYNDWMYKIVKDLPTGDLQKLIDSKQFANNKLEKFQFNDKSEKVTINNTTFSISKIPFLVDDWEVYSFSDLDKTALSYNDKIQVIIIFIAIVLLFAFIFYLQASIWKRQKLEKELEKYYMIVEQAPLTIIVTDTNGNIEYVNPNTEKITGYSFSEFIGQKPSILKSGKHDNVFYKKLWDTITSGRSWEGEIYNVKKNDCYYWEKAIITPLFNKKNKVINFIAIKEDITEKKSLEEKLRYFASTDEMTQAMNRRSGLLFLEAQIHLTNRQEGGILSICYIDIDNLKNVNDRFGHKLGDEMIVNVVSIIRDEIRISDIICRLGGDEFLVIFPNCSTNNAQEILERINQEMISLNSNGKLDYELSISYGFAEYQKDMKIISDELITLADEEMYKMKLETKKIRS